MNIGFRGFDHVHLFGERATHPIRPPSGALAARVSPASLASWDILRARAILHGLNETIRSSQISTL
ncbi:MAG: hypothetical protein LBE78_07015 [Burkholderiaceae bacterium]|jgi:hypothetical protein|nr:hypothetical protein [Burkholderiaceae bacterium]